MHHMTPLTLMYTVWWNDGYGDLFFQFILMFDVEFVQVPTFVFVIFIIGPPFCSVSVLE